jgi:hypothetical protein
MQQIFLIRVLFNSEELQWSKANLIENKEIEKYQVKKKKKQRMTICNK